MYLSPCCYVDPGQWRQDPRLSDLGVRGIFDAQQLPPPPPAGDGSSSRKQQAAGMSIISEEAFQRWRYLHGVAEGDKDIPTGVMQDLQDVPSHVRIMTHFLGAVDGEFLHILYVCGHALCHAIDCLMICAQQQTSFMCA